MLFHYTNDNGVLYSKCYISGYDNKKFHDEIDQITHDADLAHFQDIYVMPKYHFSEHYQRSKKLHKAIMNMNAEVLSALFDVQKESRKLGYDFGGSLNDTDVTYAGLFIVSRERSDEWIAGNLANYVDQYVQNVSDEENCNMSIRIVTADGKYDGDVKKNGECVVIGILVDFDFTKDNH